MNYLVGSLYHTISLSESTMLTYCPITNCLEDLCTGGCNKSSATRRSIGWEITSAVVTLGDCTSLPDLAVYLAHFLFVFLFSPSHPFLASEADAI